MHSMLGKIAFVLVLIGAINWGLIGAFDLNVVNIVNNKTLASEKLERAVYILVGLAGLFCAWCYMKSDKQAE